MNHRDKIISSVADQECEKIIAKTISALQGMSNVMQSGDDTPLENLWDEICDQGQHHSPCFMTHIWKRFALLYRGNSVGKPCVDTGCQRKVSSE